MLTIYRQTDVDYRWKEKSIRDLYEIFGVRLKKIDFSSGSPVSEHAPAVTSCWRSLDRMMEMDELVRRLKRALEGGLSPDDTIVVVRSVAPYLTAIHAAFEKAQVPYYLDEAVELISVPMVKYLQRLFKLSGGDLVRQDVIRTLKSPFCNLDFLVLSQAAVEKIDNHSLRDTVVAGREDWAKQEAQSPQLTRFFDRITPPDGELTLTQFVTWVEDIIADLLILPNDGKEVRRPAS